jgi:hypothetical protein
MAGVKPNACAAHQPVRTASIDKHDDHVLAVSSHATKQEHTRPYRTAPAAGASSRRRTCAPRSPPLHGRPRPPPRASSDAGDHRLSCSRTTGTDPRSATAPPRRPASCTWLAISQASIRSAERSAERNRAHRRHNGNDRTPVPKARPAPSRQSTDRWRSSVTLPGSGEAPQAAQGCA